MKTPRITCRRQGSKLMLLPWLLEQIDGLNHQLYNEVCAGSASLLLAQKPIATEVLNDLDDNVFALHVCLKSLQLTRDLNRLIKTTNYSASEFKKAQSFVPTTLFEKAWRYLVLSSMSLYAAEDQFDCDLKSGVVGQSKFWWGYTDNVLGLHLRLRQVIITKEDALISLRRFDTEQTLHYVDPDDLGINLNHPYTLDYQNLCEVLLSLKGYIMLSSSDNDIFNHYLTGSGWTKKYFPKDSNECLWINPKLSDYQDQNRSKENHIASA